MSKLGLTIIPGPGRKAKPPTAVVDRELEPADYELFNATEMGIKPPPIQKLSERHHALARLLATGMSQAEAALMTGYTENRVAILRQSPAFKQLLALHEREKNQEMITVIEHLSGLSRDAILELRERIEESPETFSNKELMTLIETTHDRSVDNNPTTDHLPDVIELVAPPERNADGTASDPT